MKRIFITGSSAGLGFLAAQDLIAAGNEVYVHARNEERAAQLKIELSGFKDVVVGDLSKLDELDLITAEVNKFGPMDVIIHNAGIFSEDDKNLNRLDMTKVFCVNVFAPYYLTKNIVPPKRIIFLSSDLHYRGNFDLQNLQFEKSGWQPSQAYNDSKLMLTMLCMYFSRKLPETLVNSVDPGWVPTRMGGKSATDDLDLGYETQVWLSTSNTKEACVSGKYFFHKQMRNPSAICYEEKAQEELVNYLEKFKI